MVGSGSLNLIWCDNKVIFCQTGSQTFKGFDKEGSQLEQLREGQYLLEITDTSAPVFRRPLNVLPLL